MKRKKEGDENRTYFIFLDRLQGIFQDMDSSIKPRTDEGTYDAKILVNKLMNGYELAKLGQVAKLYDFKKAENNERNFCYQYSYTILSDESVPDDLTFISPISLEAEILNLEDAIKHCKDVQLNCNDKCRQEHKQLQFWLEELLTLKLFTLSSRQ